MNMKTLRRFVGIAALVMWVVGVVSKVALGEDMLVWQIDNWALELAPLLTLAYSIMLAVHILKGKHWAIKTLGGVVCSFVVLICLLLIVVIGPFLKIKVMSYKDYLVYDEWGDFADPSVYVMYKRDGFINRRQYEIDSDQNLVCTYFDDCLDKRVEKVVFSIYEEFDLIRCTADVISESSGEECQITTFYSLVHGRCYDKSMNDSLNALVNNYNEKD